MAQIQEQKIFLGGMDKDNSPETVNLYDYRDAHNIRNLGKEGGDENYLVNLEGTLPINHSLPSGTNKAIGTARFETVSKAYTVIYNSQGYHRIEEFDVTSETITIVFENKTDSNGIDILPINPNSYFTDIRLVHEEFLILNNGINPPYCFNVNTFKSERGSKVFVEDDFLLIKKPSLSPPKFEYLSDTSRTSNSLRGELFQFRTQFEYEDYRTSTWSTVSKRVVPINEPANGQGQNVNLFNVLKVVVNVGDDKVNKLNIGVRTGLNNWLLVKTISREDVISLINTDVVIGSVNEAYNPITNEYIFLFYNDGLYTILDQTEVELLYDHVPHRAESAEVINGNVLSLGGLNEGYETPSANGIYISTSEYAPNISSTISGDTNFDVTRSALPSKSNEFTFSGTHKQGDKIYLKHKLTTSITWTEVNYEITSADALNTLPNVLRYNVVPFFDASFVPNTANVSMVSNYTMYFHDPLNRYNVEVYIKRASIGSISTQSIGSLKMNSSYQVALAYYDKYGRPFPIVTDSSMIARTKSYAEGLGNLTQIDWSLLEDAPQDAHSYQWLLSENQTHLKSIYLTGVYTASADNVNYLAFNLKSLERFNENEKDSQVTYSFTKGDKVTFVFRDSGANTTPEEWFRYPFIDLDIVDFTIEENPTVAGDYQYMLKVRSTDLLKRSGAFTYLENKEILMEIYTPKGRNPSPESIVYYEIGEQFPIVNGKHTVLNGSIRDGDWYFKGRLYESTINAGTALSYLIEDANFSDNYVSNYYSYGRGRTLLDEEGMVFKQASIRYSDEYIYGTKYNGISRFYGERIYGELGGESTSKYGAIRKLEMRDNSLVCIQEFKVGVIPVYKSIIFDNTDASLVADSGKIFGSIQYKAGSYGCGNAKESVAVSREGLIYFIDDNNCLPIRVTYSDTQVIDGNLRREFINYIKNAKNSKQKLVGVFDDNFKEYNVTVTDNSDTIYAVSFTESSTEYLNNFSVNRANIEVVSTTDCTAVYNVITGEVLVTPNTDFVGEATVTWKYTVNGVEYTQTDYVDVIAGNIIPQPFTFSPKTNQQLSTWVESNSVLITGINMPSPISILGGEYKIGELGAWTSTSGMVINGDMVWVRVMSSNSKETTTSTTLTVGGVNGVFNATTIPNSVTPSSYFNVNFEVVEPPSQSGSKNLYGVRVSLSNTLSTDYTCEVNLQYRAYGTTVSSPSHSITITAGQSSTTTSYFVNDADPSQNEILGTVLYSDFYAGAIITSADSVERIVNSPAQYQNFIY